MALAIEILIPGDRNFLVEDIDINSESFPRGSDMGLIPGLERSSGEGNGYLLQCSCLENSMDRGTWWPKVHGITKRHDRVTNTFFLPFIKINTSDFLGESKESPSFSGSLTL